MRVADCRGEKSCRAKTRKALLKQPPETGEGRNLHPLAYGIERMGLISLRFPYLVAIVLVVAAILAAFGIGRIKVDDSLSQLFRSNTPEFRQYEDVTARFPSTNMTSSLSSRAIRCWRATI